MDSVEEEQENLIIGETLSIIGGTLGRKSYGHRLRELLSAESTVTIVDPTGDYANLVDLALKEE